METGRLITAAETAEILGISLTSVRNWVRHGLLQAYEGGFSETEVQSLLKDIRGGRIDRLGRRANKREAHGNIFLNSAVDGLSRRLTEVPLRVSELMWSAALWLFREHGLTSAVPLRRLAELNPSDFRSPVHHAHLSEWAERFGCGKSSDRFEAAFSVLENHEYTIADPADFDTAGTIYQALNRKGIRSSTGSFYTPPELTRSLVDSVVSSTDRPADTLRFIDPCCGSGQFMLAFISSGGNPVNTVGIDSDPCAAFTAATNILLQCPETAARPNIYCIDSLLGELPDSLQPAGFDIAVTNPPWGAVIRNQRSLLEQRYRAVHSGESFSYFICRCLELIEDGGSAGFVLPESISNVKRHSDIRSRILADCSIERIQDAGRAFKAVYTKVITLEVKKLNKEEKKAETENNSAYAFNININTRDAAIIDRIYGMPHHTLKNNADWALGIVTGDNGRYLSDSPVSGYEPIIRGSDIMPGQILPPQKYIRFEQEKLQQTAPLWKYRAAEKLVYRFISNRLVFALDTSGCLTLNSANILIPRTDGSQSRIPAAELVKLFNSDLYSFIYRKRFNSVKILRSHLEELPLPEDLPRLSVLLNADDYAYISKSVLQPL